MSILEKNLAAIANPLAARRIQEAPPLDGLEWVQTPQEDAPTAIVHTDQGQVTLASRHRPLDEARRIAEAAEPEKFGMVVALGFGAGYHLAAAAGRIESGALVIYEPDPSLLRSLMERMDFSGLLGKPNVELFTGETDESQILGRLDRFTTLVAHGAHFMTHPAARRLNGPSLAVFSDQLAKFIAYCRTNLATTLVISPLSCVNMIANLDRYAAGNDVGELHQLARGYPAVVVSAGPSLARNAHLLADKRVRENVVVIAVQTALKPLLDRGIRPDFVTALDYHQISSRFYEGLPDLPDVTLVADPKAHPSVLDGFTGPVRILGNDLCDQLLGADAPARPRLRDGSTVAHLAFYLAQHLGCEPIILIGQDLGFSDGLYYCPGTAIHQVWSGELNPFNTLEMMELKRVLRHRSHLQKVEDIHGRPIYTDEQMATYLRQFLRDFAQAPQRVIDATEGGVPKQHTLRMTLREALEKHALRKTPQMLHPGRTLDPAALKRGRAAIGRRLGEIQELRQATLHTQPILRKMIRDQMDRRKMEPHFEALEKQKKIVHELNEAFEIMNHLNQIGAIKRERADRAIQNDSEQDEVTRQRRQLERDIENLGLILEACDQIIGLMGRSIERIDGRLAAGPEALDARQGLEEARR